MPVFYVRVRVETVYDVYIEADDSGDAYTAADRLTPADLKAKGCPQQATTEQITDYDVERLASMSPDFDAAELLARD